MNEIVQPTVSVVVPWCNRQEVVGTVQRNWPFIRSIGGELILVNCAGDHEQFQNLLRESGVSGVRAVEVPAPVFSKALALNIGVGVMRAPHFFCLDSDVVLGEDALPLTMAAIEGKPAFATISWMHESEPVLSMFGKALATCQNDYLRSMITTVSSVLTFGDGTTLTVPVSKENVFTGSRFGCGLLLVKREDILAVNGYNSELMMWGWEDLDIQLRLKKHLRLEHVEAGEVCHLTHGDEQRALNGQSRHATNLENLARAFTRYSLGDFQGTLEADVNQWRSTLQELPV